ncbi:MAG TPA: PAS domain-containing protein [Acidimicrobiales bacterium]|jgi:predicted transcriptional regulator YheO
MTERLNDSPGVKAPATSAETTSGAPADERFVLARVRRAKAVNPATAGQAVALRDSLKTLGAIVPMIARAMGPSCEVILHDFERLPNSIVAIGGDLTHRAVGGPINAFALEKMKEGASKDFINYETHSPDGMALRSSTIFIRNEAGEATACLCINVDVSGWLKLRDVLDAFVGYGDAAHAVADDIPGVAGFESDETFPSNVEDVMVEAVAQAIASVGIPAELMHKRHKKEVVNVLDARGLFLIRDAVDFVANELGVTRYTIYNYLNELKSDAENEVPPRRRSPKGVASAD